MYHYSRHYQGSSAQPRRLSNSLGDMCKGTTHFQLHTCNSDCGCATPPPHLQLRSWLCNSDSTYATLTVAAQLRLRRHNPLRLLSPRHQPHCTHLPIYCTVLSHACLAYIVVTPSRVFLRVFSLDFPLLG